MAIFQWRFFSATWSRQQQQRIPDRAATMKQFKHWQSESIGKSLRSTVVQSKIIVVSSGGRGFSCGYISVRFEQMISYNIYSLQFYVNYPARRNVWRTTNWPWPGSLSTTTTHRRNVMRFAVRQLLKRVSFYLLSRFDSVGCFLFLFVVVVSGEAISSSVSFAVFQLSPHARWRRGEIRMLHCILVCLFIIFPFSLAKMKANENKMGEMSYFFFLLSPFPPRISLNIFTGNLAGAGNGCLSAAAAFRLLFAGDDNENGQ